MSERLLEAFREKAEASTPVPAFETIEAAGRARRRRRHATVALIAACTLGVAGFVAATDGAPDAPRPAGGPDPSSIATPWPGPTMTTLPGGTYDLTPYADVTLPAAQVTIPDGWNAQYGPDLFAGVGPAGSDNGRALRRSPWYAGLVVTEVDSLSEGDCDTNFLIGAGSEEVLAALMELPRLEVTSGPDTTTRFGHPAVHLGMRDSRREPVCPYGGMFGATEGRIGDLGLGGTYDLWLVDVDGEPLLVMTAWSRNAPRSTVAELQGMADTIELHPRHLPWRD
ncbi:hypothetical protein [Nocardioides sp. P5_C9_2]